MNTYLRFGQFVSLQSPQQASVNGFQKNLIPLWEKAYGLGKITTQTRQSIYRHQTKATRYKFTIPADSIGLLKAVSLNRYFETYEVLILSPVTQSYRGINNTLYLSGKDINFDPIVPLDSPLRQLQADYILSLSSKGSSLEKYQQIHELQTLNNI